MLKGVSTESKAGLAHRIHPYFAKVKGVPVVYRWRYGMEEIDPTEKTITKPT